MSRTSRCQQGASQTIPLPKTNPSPSTNMVSHIGGPETEQLRAPPHSTQCTAPYTTPHTTTYTTRVCKMAPYSLLGV